MENIRQDEILIILKKRGNVSVKELSSELFVSEMTVRRDLAELEKCGFLTRYRGGAACKTKGSDYPINIRCKFCEKGKRELAALAAKHIRDDSLVFLDSSTISTYIVMHISEKNNVRIVTNSVYIALIAAQFHIPCDLVGGKYVEKDMCLVGNVAIRQLSEINPDIAFISSSSLSDDGIISDGNEQQTEVRRAAIKNAKKRVFLFDSAKLHRVDTFNLCRVSKSDIVITEQEV